MKYHRTFGPPSKPGHGRGSAPYGRSDSTSCPWGGPSWTVLNNAPVAKLSLWNMAWRSLELSLGSWLSETWRDALLNSLSALGSLKHGVTLSWTLSLKHGVTLSWTLSRLLDSLLNSLGSWLSGTSLFNIAGAALVTPLPSRALTWTLSRHRLNQPSIRRLEGTTSKNNELNAYGRKQPHLSCFHPRAPGDARTNPRGSRAQRPEQPFEGNETTSNLLLVNKQVHSN